MSQSLIPPICKAPLYDPSTWASAKHLVSKHSTPLGVFFVGALFFANVFWMRRNARPAGTLKTRTIVVASSVQSTANAALQHLKGEEDTPNTLKHPPRRGGNQLGEQIAAQVPTKVELPTRSSFREGSSRNPMRLDKLDDKYQNIPKDQRAIIALFWGKEQENPLLKVNGDTIIKAFFNPHQDNPLRGSNPSFVLSNLNESEEISIFLFAVRLRKTVLKKYFAGYFMNMLYYIIENATERGIDELKSLRGQGMDSMIYCMLYGTLDEGVERAKWVAEQLQQPAHSSRGLSLKARENASEVDHFGNTAAEIQKLADSGSAFHIARLLKDSENKEKSLAQMIEKNMQYQGHVLPPVAKRLSKQLFVKRYAVDFSFYAWVRTKPDVDIIDDGQLNRARDIYKILQKEAARRRKEYAEMIAKANADALLAELEAEKKESTEQIKKTKRKKKTKGTKRKGKAPAQKKPRDLPTSSPAVQIDARIPQLYRLSMELRETHAPPFAPRVKRWFDPKLTTTKIRDFVDKGEKQYKSLSEPALFKAWANHYMFGAAKILGSDGHRNSYCFPYQYKTPERVHDGYGMGATLTYSSPSRKRVSQEGYIYFAQDQTTQVIYHALFEPTKVIVDGMDLKPTIESTGDEVGSSEPWQMQGAYSLEVQPNEDIVVTYNEEHPLKPKIVAHPLVR